MVLGVWGVILCGVLAAFRKEEKAARKYKELVEKTLSAPNSVIRFEGDEASLYLAYPRGYDVVLFVTSRGCKYCQGFQTRFEEAAELYAAQQAYRPRRRRSATTVRRPVFFAILTLTQRSQELVTRYGVKTLPTLVYATAEEARMAVDTELHAFLEPLIWGLNPRETLTLQRLLDWVNHRAGERVRAWQSPLRMLKVLVLMASGLGALVALYVLLPGVVLNEKVWLVAGLGVFVVGAGGCFSALMSGAPLMDPSPQGPVLFRTGSRTQTLGEGFVAMGMMLAMAFALIGATNLLRRGRPGANLACLCLLAGSLWLLLALEGVFRSKNFYNPMFFPPRYFIRGPLINDNGVVV